MWRTKKATVKLMGSQQTTLKVTPVAYMMNSFKVYKLL